ncbi:mono-functional DNA-alkylating methyl methanesulfonate N-term-domain-containing protein [Crassisporium funariophilum]|nr:mono-functional DNA-alkylating methyl methanesulfonate N-term-domain-containing protein [Crassisporium funariophilum]
MKIVSIFHPSSSVLCSVKCRLASRDIEHLVVGKLNRLDVYSLRPHGLQHECGADVRGTVCSIQAIPIDNSGMRSNLVLMIAHPEPELVFLSYSESEDGTAELTVKKQLSLLERSARVGEFFANVIIHPSGKLAVVGCYAGKLKIVNLKAGNYKDDFDVSLPELNVFALSFLPTLDHDYTLAILYFDAQDRLQLSARDLDLDALELSSHPSPLLHSTVISNKSIPCPTDIPPLLIPVPPSESNEDGINEAEDAFQGGVLVVGGRQILLYEVCSKEEQEKQKGKRKRLEAKKKSSDSAEISKAKAKERERESRRRKPNATVEWPYSNVTAWCSINQESSRFLIGDAFGRLVMLSVENVHQFGIVLVPLGEASSPMTLTYLTNQIVYLGSHSGDSQLVQVSASAVSTQELPSLAIPREITTVSSGSLSTLPSKKGKEKAISQGDMDVDHPEQDDFSKGRVVTPTGCFINVLQSFKSIAPIVDAILVDIDGSGENQIVTCSGLGNTGSVNVVRNGADFQELAFIPGITDVTRIWSIRAKYNDTQVVLYSHIVVSTLNETHLFQINDRGNKPTFARMEISSFAGLVAKQPTLAFSNIYERVNGIYQDSSLVVQVVPTGAFLLQWDFELIAYVERASWEVKNIATSNARTPEIVAASINASQVALALNGGHRVVLCIENNAIQFREVMKVMKVKSDLPEVSAISCIPLNPQKHASNLISMAYWNSNVVEIFSISEGKFTSESKSPSLPAVVRSIVLYNFGSDTSSKGQNYHAYLLAGLGDGSVAAMVWKDGQLKDLKIIPLGHAPVSLTAFEVDGKKTVFAAGNRATILSFDRNRLVNSPIMLKEISATSQIKTNTFGSSLILAAPTGLHIGRARELNKMHIRSANLGLDNPHRIIHEPSLKAFGVVCNRNEPTRIGDFEPTKSSFRLLDDNSLAHLGQVNLESDEEIASVTSFSMSFEGQKRPFFCLGTFRYKPEETEPSSGRLLIYTAYTSAKQSRVPSLELSLVTYAEVKGLVFDIKFVEEKIVAAVNSSVLLYRLDCSSEELTTPLYSLKNIADWNHNYMVTSLGAYEDRIVAGDQISSVSLLKVTDTKLIPEARDYGPLHPICVEALDSANLICANDALNIYTFVLGKAIGRMALERNGCYFMADMVSKFVRGSLSTVDNSKESDLKPEALFFTSSGRIGVIVDVQSKDLSMHLTELQRNLSAVINGVGGTSHTRFRAPKNTRGPSDADGAAFGLIDGDFLEQYLGLLGSPQQLDRVTKGQSAPEVLKLSSDAIVKVLEQLQSLH